MMKYISPQQYYQQQIQAGILLPDAEQQLLIHQLDELFVRIQHIKKRSKFFKLFSKTREPVKGLYIWGGVGVGKTLVMDIFFNCLPTSRKLRLHFHQFMKMIHEQLTCLSHKADPLKTVAIDIAKQFDVICFDEFFVSDIGDAMILARLLTVLFEQGVCLVATSNCAPDDLYRHGFQRESFLPAIALIKQYTKQIAVKSAKDYRVRNLPQANVYFTPLDEVAHQQLHHYFTTHAKQEISWNQKIIINQRNILTVAKANGMVWFDFTVICHSPRNQMDYLSLAQSYHTVLVSNVPKLTVYQHDATRYLINLVDVFYDAHIKLILSAAAPVAELYETGILLADFQRTKSRLYEMQSEAYIKYLASN